ncbi:MAG: VPDSG-CTERM sorting domain-containing protein [Opitutales bacterium]
MKTLTKLLTVLAILGLSQSVFGVSYLYETATYVDQQFWLVAPQMNDATQTISGTLDISEDGVEAEDWDKVGYNPNSETITAVEILFAIDSHLINIQFGGEDAGSADIENGNLNGLLTGNPYIHATNFSGSGLDGSLLFNLLDTGVLNWTLSLTDDQLGTSPPTSVGLVAASLAVQVPDSGATIGFFGVTLLGLAGMRRMFAQR